MDLSKFEEISEIFFTSSDQNERQAAELYLSHLMEKETTLQDISEAITVDTTFYCQHLCLLLCKDLVTKHYSSIDKKLQQVMQERLFKYLMSIANTSFQDLTRTCSQVLARMLKLGYTKESPDNNDFLLFDEFHYRFFINLDPFEMLLGTRLLTSIINEFNEFLATHETIQHYRDSLNWFKGTQLFPIFQLSIQILDISTSTINIQIAKPLLDFFLEQKENCKPNENNKYAKLFDYYHTLLSQLENGNEDESNLEKRDQIGMVFNKLFDTSLNLLISILKFNYSFFYGSKEKNRSETKKIFIPSNWSRAFLSQHHLIYLSLIKQFQATMESYQNQSKSINNKIITTNQEISTETERLSKIFHCFKLLFSIDLTFFHEDLHLIKNFLDFLFGSIQEITFINKDFFEEIELKLAFSQLNQTIIYNWDFEFLILSIFFNDWLNFIYEFTMANCKGNNLNSNILYFLSSFWGIISDKFIKYLNNRNSSNNNDNDNNSNNNDNNFIMGFKKILLEISKLFITLKIEQILNENILFEQSIERIEELFFQNSNFLSELNFLNNLITINYFENLDYLFEQFETIIMDIKTNNFTNENIKTISLLLVIFSNLFFNSNEQQNYNKQKILIIKDNKFESKKNENYLKLETQEEINHNNIIIISKIIDFIKFNEELITNNNNNKSNIYNNNNNNNGNEGTTLIELSILIFFKQFVKLINQQHDNDNDIFLKNLFQSIEEFANYEDLFFFFFLKSLRNLNRIKNEKSLIVETIDFFYQLISVKKLWPNTIYNSMEILDLFENHSEEKFSFLNNYLFESNIRINFHKFLSKLLFLETNKLHFLEKFEKFILVYESYFQIINQKINNDLLMETNSIKIIFSLIQDLRGIIIEANSSNYFIYIFEWLYPQKFEIILKIFKKLWIIPKIGKNIILLCRHLVSNKKINYHQNNSDCLKFGIHSKNFFLLVNFAIENLTIYINNYFPQINKSISLKGNKRRNKHNYNNFNLFQNSNNKNTITKIKSIELCYTLLKEILNIKEIHFGVFKAYQDDTLKEIIYKVFFISQNYPQDYLIIYPKLSNSYYSLLKTISKRHLYIFLSFDLQNFEVLLNHIIIGINSSNKKIFKRVCYLIEKLLFFYYKNHQNPFQKFDQKIQLAKNFHANYSKFNHHFKSILSKFLELIIFENVFNSWAISNPLLALILLNQNHFLNLKESYINQTNSKYTNKVKLIFNILLEKIDNNSSNLNKTNFFSNLNTFRKLIRENSFF
ncbi:exportin [Anaeramoeba flamelloides]|uniref:Exportin n=1 Tax=Anaeramoeba flamelloides TaxID=1746091 RepID=A0AAV7Z024_9EUKA|nr:exportin [Anaeramoeba flamelloides]